MGNRSRFFSRNFVRRTAIAFIALFSISILLQPQTRYGKAHADPFSAIVVFGLTAATLAALIDERITNGVCHDVGFQGAETLTMHVCHKLGNLSDWSWQVADGPTKSYAFQSESDAEKFVIERIQQKLRLPSGAALPVQ